MGISVEEILKGKVLEDQSEEIQANLPVLSERVSALMEEGGFHRVVTSGLRTKEDHIRIYRELAAKRGVPFDESKIPWGSLHLKGSAVDVADPDHSLHNFCTANDYEMLKKHQLWIEKIDDQGRVHFQIFPPKSGKWEFAP